MDKFKNWVEIASKFLVLGSAISLTLSVTYDWGYLLELGLTFQVVSTSISDHARSAVIWLPAMAATSFFGVVFWWWLETTERKKEPQALTSDQLIEESQLVRQDETSEKTPVVLSGEKFDVEDVSRPRPSGIVLVICLSVLAILLFGDRFNGAHAFLFISVWMALALNLPIPLHLSGMTKVAIRWLIFVLPLFPLLTFFAGKNDARTALIAPTSKVNVTLRGSSTPRLINLKLLRTFERVTIFSDSAGKVGLLRSDDIQEIQAIGEPVPFQDGVLCTLLNLTCLKKNQ